MHANLQPYCRCREGTLFKEREELLAIGTGKLLYNKIDAKQNIALMARQYTLQGVLDRSDRATLGLWRENE